VLVLLVPDLRRLVGAVFARRDEPVLVGRAGLYVKGIGVALLFATIALAMNNGEPPRRTMYGSWDVVRYVRDGVELPPGIDPVRWKFVAIRSSVMIKTSDGEDHFHRISPGSDQRLELGEGGNEGSFLVTFHDDDARTLTGRYAGHELVVELRRGDLSQMPLLTRGFHWIQEYPYNH
jgi:hypothetical protein